MEMEIYYLGQNLPLLFLLLLLADGARHRQQYPADRGRRGAAYEKRGENGQHHEKGRDGEGRHAGLPRAHDIVASSTLPK